MYSIQMTARRKVIFPQWNISHLFYGRDSLVIEKSLEFANVLIFMQTHLRKLLFYRTFRVTKHKLIR